MEWIDEPPEPPPPPRRIVLLGLLHEKDWFKELEDSLPAGLLVTRALRDFSVKLMLNSTLKELYEVSYCHRQHIRDVTFTDTLSSCGTGNHPVDLTVTQLTRTDSTTFNAPFSTSYSLPLNVPSNPSF